MYNHTPGNVRGGLGPRHGEDPSLGGGSHGLGIVNPQHQHQQYTQQQAHDPHQQTLFPSNFGFASSPHQPSNMSDYSSSMGHGQTQFQTQGDAMDIEDAEPEPRVTNLIAHFENNSNNSRRPSKPAHNVPGAASTAFGRATNRVTSPTTEQFTSSLRVRSGSIGRPPPARFGSMGQQGHSGLRVASPMASQAGEAHGSRDTGHHNPHAPDASASSFRNMSGPTDIPTPLRRQPSNAGAGMRPGHVGNISASLYSNVGSLSSSAGHFEGASSPYGFASSAHRAVRPMHMMGGFGGMGEGSAGSPIIGTPTSPFGSMDFSGPRVISPVHNPQTDPFGELVHFGTSMGDNPVSPFDTMSPGGRVTTPMQQSSGAGTYRGSGMDGKESGFVGSHGDHFQGLDPFNSMGSMNQHATHQFGDMSAAASMETWGDLGVFAKEEPSTDTTQFDAISPAPRGNDMAQTPMNFAGQEYFDSQPPQPPPRPIQQQPRPRPRPVPAQPPARPAKKPFLRQQDTAGHASTPGFNIWKPPVPSTPKPAIGNTHQHSSAMPSTSNTPFLPQSAADIKVEAEDDLLSQPFSADMPVTSPNVMPSSITSPSLDTLSAASPNPPPLPVRPHQGARPSREQVPAEAWEAVKGTIRQLYLEERKPLKEVIQVMAEQHGFQATPKMYKTRFSQWGFVKNNTEEEVKKLLSMKFQRDARGKVTEFVRNGRIINLGTYLKRKGVTEYDLVDFQLPADLPAYVRCRTPTPPPVPGYLRSPDLLRAQEAVVGNIRKAFLQCRQSELDAKTTVGWATVMVWGSGSSKLLHEANKRMKAGAAAHEVGFDGAFTDLEEDLMKLSPLAITEVLLAMVRRDPGMTTALIKYLAACATTNFDRAHPLRQILTTLYEVQQKHGPVTLSDLVWGCVPAAADELESIYGRRHPYVARTWIGLALGYDHADGERLEGLVAEYQGLRAAVQAREGADSSDAFAVRYALVQLVHAASPESDGARAEASALWDALKECGRANPLRSGEGNAYCVHDAVKVVPWVKRCGERYESVAALLRRHVGAEVVWYFEEDMHTAEHAVARAPEPRDAWAAAMGHASIGMGQYGRY